MSKRQFLEDMVNSIMENKIEDAREKFHQFVVESAREIHASLIETDELEDDIDDTMEESFEEVVETDSDEDTDFGADVGVGGEDLSDMGDDVDPDMDGDNDSEEDHVEVEVNELDQVKAMLADLQAKFAEITGEGEPEEAGDDFGGEGEEVDMGDEGEVEESVFEADDMEGDKDEDGDEDSDDTMEESTDFDLTEEDLLGLEEGWSEVKVSMDGGELDGKFATPEKTVKTPVADKEEKEVDAKDMVSKQDAHKGYEREKSPAVAPAKTHATNIMTSGKKAWSEEHPKMDGQEQGGGKFATPEKSKTTPVAKK